jgi:hypothetical protein
MEYLLAPIFWLLGLLASILWWVFMQIVWIVLWLLLPLAILAFVALRVAEHVLGQEKVRAWVKSRTQKYGVGIEARSTHAVRARRLADPRAVLVSDLRRVAQHRQPSVAAEMDALAAGMGEALAPGAEGPLG